MARHKLFSVTLADCRVDAFTVGGNGGSGKDTSNTGARVTHEPSGGVGRATDTRSGAKNKAMAFRRMGETKEFQLWARLEAARLSGKPSVESQVEEAMKPENLKIEGLNFKGQWVPFDEA